MDTGYRKTEYAAAGFWLTHTVGMDAGQSTINHPHINADRMLLYFIHGSGNVMMGEKSYRIQAGDMILTHPTQLYHCAIDSNMFHERIVVHIDQTFFQQFPCDISRLQNRQSCYIGGSTVAGSGLTNRITELLDLVQQDSLNSNILAVCKLTELLVQLDEITERADREVVQRNHLIDRVLAYLNENFADAISVDTVAAHFHITSSYLSHLFKDHTGLPLWNYVILRRLQLVNSLMRQGLSAEDACYRAGFENYANFYRLYKKHLGMTPSQYKKQAQ